MIYLEKTDQYLRNPEHLKSGFLSVEEKNYLYKNLDKGKCIFLIPEDIENADKKIKRNYKVGFLFDLLGNVYPGKNQTEKFQIISEKYHFWITHRQFRNILDEYQADRLKYLNKRSLLCI